MDMLIQFCRHVVTHLKQDCQSVRHLYLDTKFVSHLSKLYPRFSKSPAHEQFTFPKTITDPLKIHDVLPYPNFLDEVHRIYIPFNLDKRHWISLVVDLQGRKILVLDCNNRLRTDANMCKEIRPLAEMIPFLVRQVVGGATMYATEEFVMDRVRAVPQIHSPNDAGVMAYVLILEHAAEGMDGVLKIDVTRLDEQAKKLAIALIEKYNGGLAAP